MKQFTFASLLLLLLLLPGFATFPVEAQTPHPSIHIQADGSLYGTRDHGTDNIARDGDRYTFLGDIVGTLHVEKDNVVIDGAGYTLTGENGRGVVLEGRQGVTVRSVRMVLDGGYLVDLTNASDCVLDANIFAGATQSILNRPIAVNFLRSEGITVQNNIFSDFFYGLSMSLTSGDTIINNTFTDGVLGLSLDGAGNCLFRDNRLVNCNFGVGGFSGGSYLNDLDASNTVDGNPIYYLTNMRDQVVPSDGDTIVLANCQNILIQDTHPKSINLFSTRNVTLTGVTLTERSTAGITLTNCTDVTIQNSNIDGSAIGIRLSDSSGNRVVGNSIANTMTRGVDLINSTGNVFAANTFTGNRQAMGQAQLFPSEGNLIVANKFLGNGYALTVQGATVIQDNTFEGNEVAISFPSTSGSTVTQNIFKDNGEALYFNAASNNTVYRNNFYSNGRQVVDAGENGTSAWPYAATAGSGKVQFVAAHVDGVNFFPPPPPSTNTYDHDGVGNYWIDYTGGDADGDGVGDIPYTLYENNTDHYPQMQPFNLQPPDAQNYDLPTPTAQGSNPSNDMVTVGSALECVAIVAVVALLVAVGLMVYRRKRQKPVMQIP